MKHILAQLTVFLSVSAFAQYNGTVSQFSERTSILLVVGMPGGGGGNGPYKNIRDKWIDQVEEHKEEIKERAKLFLETRGYSYDSLNITVAVAKEVDQFIPFITTNWGIGLVERKYIELSQGSLDTADADFEGKLFPVNTASHLSSGEFYMIHPGGGGGNGPYLYKETGGHWRGQAMLEEQGHAVAKIKSDNKHLVLIPFARERVSYFDKATRDWEAGIPFSGNYGWNDEGEQEAVKIRLVIKEIPPNLTFENNLWNTDYGYIAEPVKTKEYNRYANPYDDIQALPFVKILYAEPLGGGGGAGGNKFYDITGAFSSSTSGKTNYAEPLGGGGGGNSHVIQISPIVKILYAEPLGGGGGAGGVW